MLLELLILIGAAAASDFDPPTCIDFGDDEPEEKKQVTKKAQPIPIPTLKPSLKPDKTYTPEFLDFQHYLPSENKKVEPLLIARPLTFTSSGYDPIREVQWERIDTWTIEKGK